METTIKHIDSGAVQLTVQLGKEELHTYIEKIRDQIGQEIAVEGFRKGKAPKDLLEKNIPIQQVREAALQTAIQDSLARAIKEKNLDVAKSADLAIDENTAEILRYHVTLNIFPETKLPELAQIKVTPRTIKVEPHEIDETLKTIQNMRATFTPKETPVQEGDRVEVDFKVILDGKPLEGGESKNHPLIIGGKGFIPGFEEQLIGLAKGQEKRFSLIAPDDYFQKNLAGKKLDFEVTVQQVQSVQLPELNDAFSQQLGKFANVDELKNNVQQGILHEKEEKERQRVRLEIVDSILAKTKVESPEFLVHDQLELMVQNFDSELHTKGMELNIYLAQLNKTVDDLKKDWLPHAQKQAKTVVLLHAVAKAHAIMVSEEEINQAANDLVQGLISREQIDPSEVNLQEVHNHVAQQLLNEKVFSTLERICT